MCARLGDRVLLDTGRERIVLDFPNRRVVGDDGQPCRYLFCIDDALVRTCVRERYDDWVNALFLSCRFSASRPGNWIITAHDHLWTATDPDTWPTATGADWLAAPGSAPLD